MRTEALIALGVRTIHGSGEDAQPAPGEPRPSEAEIAAKIAELSMQRQLDDYSRAIQAHLDATARERQYDSIHTLIGYRGDPNPEFAAEAEAGFVWRSAVWTYANAELAKVMAGQREQPTVEDFIAELPAMVWPD